MGPPKKSKAIPYDDLIRKYDYFEYRWNDSTESYYLYNPHTGETCIQPSFENLDRSKSYWADPDPIISKDAHSVVLFRESYASRQWGRRKYEGWANRESAATCIAAVIRGFLVRQNLRQYFRMRYSKKKCLESGYLYFIDHYSGGEQGASTWHKPLLAFPDDILMFKKYDPEDYKGPNDKYSFLPITFEGPFVKRAGLGKANKARAKHTSFIPENPWRDIAISEPGEIDLENTPLNSIISWMDGTKSTSIVLTEYAQMRAAIVDNDWGRVLAYMKKSPDNPLCQIFGFHSFSKADIPLDVSGILDYAAAEVLEIVVEMLKKPTNEVSSGIRVFALHALYNLLCSRQGRAEHFNIMSVIDGGEGRTAAIENYIRSRIIIFNKYLTQIPMETEQFCERGSEEMKSIEKPTLRACDTVELVFKCLCAMAHEPEYREQMSFITVDAVIHAMKVCAEVAAVVMPGLIYMYNLCYRCESGQEALLHCGAKGVIELVKYNHSGDPDILYQSRRLELALKQDGWRGNVEEHLEKEMKGDDIDSEWLHSLGDEQSFNGIGDLVDVANPSAAADEKAGRDGPVASSAKDGSEGAKGGDLRTRAESKGGDGSNKSHRGSKDDGDSKSIASELTA